MKNYYSIKQRKKGLRTMTTNNDELFPAIADSAILKEAWEVLRENVDRGEKFLDKERPGWYKKVNLSDLDMEQGNKCICGWVFDDMVRTMVGDLLVVSGYEYFSLKFQGIGRNLGFLSDSSLYPSVMIAKQYPMLAELWTEKIQKRLANDGLL